MEYHTYPVKELITNFNFPLYILERCINEVRKWKHEPDWVFVSSKYRVLFPASVVNVMGVLITFMLHKDDRLRMQWELPKHLWTDKNPFGSYMDVLFTEEETKLLDGLLKEYYENKRKEDYIEEEYK